MAFLSLSDDEIALLRFTCDLFFVEESPLFSLEAAQREPTDYETTYQALVEKGVIDPHGFRITDESLNRIAPVTECDARVVHLIQPAEGAIEQTDWYLLDEIAVQYRSRGSNHAIGPDLDPDELLEHLAKRLVPRKATGDAVDLKLRPIEMLALAMLARGTRESGEVRVDLDRARALLGNPPTAQASTAPAPQLLAMMPVRASEPKRRRTAAAELTGDRAWDAALSSLIEAGAVLHDGDVLEMRPAVLDVARAVGDADRHTFVRYDFGDEEWLMRETTLLAAEGALYFLGASGDRLRVRELDGESFRGGLREAVGPLARDTSAPAPRPLRELLAREPTSAEGAPA